MCGRVRDRGDYRMHAIRPCTKYRTKPLIHYLEELTHEEVSEMLSTLSWKDPHGSNGKRGPFTAAERPAVCCTVYARMLADQIDPETEIEWLELLVRQIDRGFWRTWKSD